MTDKEKLNRVIAEIRRLYVYWDGVMQNSAATEAVARKNQCKELLSFIDSMQGKQVDYGKLKTSLDNALAKATKESWEKFLQEDSKECMYTKDHYTDKDRKVLCDGCEEECKYSKSDDFTKALAECIHQAQGNVVDPMVLAETWKDELIKLAKSEEPVSEDLDEAAKIYAKGEYDRKNPSSLPWQCKGCYSPLIYAFKDGAQWQKEQFEKNRLKHCDSITNEQAELEQKFLDQHLDKYNRMPTFLDAIEYGMRLQKEQMRANAIEGYWIARDAPDILHPLRIHDNKIERKILDDGRKYWYCRHGDSIYLPSNLFQEIQWENEPCKVKLLVLKEE